MLVEALLIGKFGIADVITFVVDNCGSNALLLLFIIEAIFV